jgi:hypothetical protein
MKPTKTIQEEEEQKRKEYEDYVSEIEHKRSAVLFFMLIVWILWEITSIFL